MQDESGKAALGSPAVASATTAQNSLHLNGHNINQNGHNTTATPAPQPQFGSGAPSPAPSPVPVIPREQWGGKYEFLLSCIGYCVGLGNVWRFPYLCYRNGGGVFLIPYFIMLFVTGVPLFLMELSLGQYGAAGPITVWKCIGIGMLCVSCLVCLYYNVIIAWTFYYLVSSLQSPLPWSCDAIANIGLCGNITTNSSAGRGLSPTEKFWNERVLGVVNSEGLHDPGPVRWPLALCLLAAWIIIFLCMLKGIRSSGKGLHWKALLGIAFYLTPDWSRLANAQVWNDAASQVFYSLGIGVGGLLSMASYNKFDNNVIRDTLIITGGNCCTSFFAGFAIFSILGHMASWVGLCCLPEALALLPGSVFWSIMFFLMLFMMGIDTLFGNMEGITTAVLDEFPHLRTNTLHKSLFLGTLCFCFYLMGLLLVTDGGIYWFTLIDSFSTSFGLIIITLFMCMGISFFYGSPSNTPNLHLILIYIFMEMYNTSLHYGPYVYPRWGKALGVCIGATCCMQIPIWAIVALCKETGTFKDRFQKSIRPLNSWRVNLNSSTRVEQHMEPERVEAPFTVTLTDMDFTAMTWDAGSEA
ncbi:hypothetical protein F7725_007098 [Dissostichus mawsoni]|uniref:Transporter n=1 Tax=Dissostichus mawsoni TaxID=36200 RepID=A0A7J5XVU1_DISMA|nr:hypothetical protein F7725_007098 [Dissostichus mawsoni]